MQLSAPTANVARRTPVDKQLDVLSISALSVILSLHAAWRGTRSDFDAEGYSIWFDRIRGLPTADFLALLANSGLYFDSDLLFSFETGFAVFTFVLTRLSSSLEFFFFCSAALGLSLKAIAIVKFCEKPLPAFLWYVSWSYLLLEMTSIRAGIAAGILLLGYGYLRDRRIAAYLLVVAAASTFHASSAAAVLLLVALLANRPRWIFIALVGCIGLSFLSIVPVIGWLSEYNEKLSEYYRLYVDLGLYEVINRFNVVVLLRIGLLLITVGLLASDARPRREWMLDAALFCFPIGIYYAFSSFPVIGGRLYELLGVFQIFLISRIFISRSSIPKLLATSIMAIQFSVLVFHVRFVDFFYFFGTPYNLETIHRL